MTVGMKSHITRNDRLPLRRLAGVLVFVVNLIAAPPETTPTNTKPSFSIQQIGATSWLVKPDGERFFSMGVCCVSPGASREEFDPDNPAYACWQYYPSSSQWAEFSLARLKSWGFTTVGAWSDFPRLIQCHDSDLALTPVLHIVSTAGAPLCDMWDP